MAMRNKVIAGIIATAVVGLGVTAVVLTGGLAAIAFLAVGAVASAAIMYGGIEQDRKAEMGPKAYRAKYGYGLSGGIKEIGNFFKRLGKSGKQEKEELSSPKVNSESTTTPEKIEDTQYKGKFNSVVKELGSLKPKDDSNIVPSHVFTPKETQEADKLKDKEKAPDPKVTDKDKKTTTLR